MADDDLAAAAEGIPTLEDIRDSQPPPPDCPVCPHVIRTHDAGGCTNRRCACAVPGSELELAARRRGRVLADDELAVDLVIDEADVEPAATPGDTADTPADTPETGADTPDTADTPGDNDGEPAPPEGYLTAAFPPGQARKGRRIYDWPAIKRRYVEGVPLNDGSGLTEWPSLDAVAEHFGMPPQRIREKSSIEGWVGLRQKWQAQMEATRQQARANALAQAGTEVDKKALDASQLGLQLCLAVLGDRARAVQAQRTANNGQEGAHITMSALELSRLAQAVDLWHRIGLRAVGDPEVTRLEVTGAGGRPIEITSELKRDDPQRLAGVLAVLTQAGLGDLFGGADPRGALEARRGDDGVYSTEGAD